LPITILGPRKFIFSPNSRYSRHTTVRCSFRSPKSLTSLGCQLQSSCRLRLKAHATPPLDRPDLYKSRFTLPWSLLGGLHHAQNAASRPLRLRATCRPLVLASQAKILWVHCLKLGCSAVRLHGNASMRHPVELVIQVVAQACWAPESTASRPKIKAVRRSCMHSCCGLIKVDLVMEPPAQPIRATLAAPAASSSHPGTRASPRAGEFSLRTARLFLGGSQNNEYVECASTAEGGIGRAMGCANALKRRVWQRAWTRPLTLVRV
jgi:hypothetical protein